MKLFDKIKKKKISELIKIAQDAKKDPVGLVKDKSVGELVDMVKFSKGGMIFGGDGRGIRVPVSSGLIGFVPDGRPPVPFRRGGKIRKGSPAMKRKMARLRAMRR
jgi:hypothetical protein